MESEAAYKEEIQRLLASSVRPLAIIDTAIAALCVLVALCLVKLVQLALL